MIAPTGRRCKSPSDSDAQIPARIASAEKRHGIVSGIIIRPHFRQATALLACHNVILRWPGPFVPDSSAPSPPGRRDRACSQDSLSPYWANESWSFFLFGVCHAGRLPHEARAQHWPRTAITIMGIDFRACAKSARPRMCDRTSAVTVAKFSAAWCRPPLASGRACRDCRPGRTPPLHRRLLGKYFPAARSSFQMSRSSHRP